MSPNSAQTFSLTTPAARGGRAARASRTAIAVLLAFAAAATAAWAVPADPTNLVWCAGSKTCLQWTPVPAATRYAVYRGTRAQLPMLLTSSVDSCDRRAHAPAATATSLTETPVAGTMYWYLVAAEDACGQGPAGSASAGPHVVNASGYCEPWCGNAALDGDETSQDCGGSCGPCADGASCNSSGDCQSRRCVGSQCLPATCSDGISNGAETGIDCGGPCAPCVSGGGCCAGSDCQSATCSGDLCGAPPCSNGVQDGGETDVDCGGTCPGCASGQHCQFGPDCASQVCSTVSHVCLPATCSDGVRNGTETDVDCGGGSCPVCAVAKHCSVGGDCQGGNCVDGVCCNNACSGACQACSAAKKGSGADGVCGQIGNGLDPDNECPGTAACNGSGQCASANGGPCSVSQPCLSGNFCVDGVCCSSQCFGVCQACSAARKGQGSDGTCGPILNGTDPDNECSGTAVCNGSGACVSPNGAACATNANCQSGFCVDGFCCDAACNGFCQACSAVRKGTGANGVCGNIAMGFDPDNECAGAGVCNGSGACAMPDGSSCTTGTNCVSGFCVDGVCCNTACTGTCQACSVTKTMVIANGTCGPVFTGIDPDNECPGDAFCSAGACVSPNGTACTAGAQCSSGNCVDGFCCNNACSGLCQACSAAKRGGGSNGSCGPVNPGTDPDNECAGTSTCTAQSTCSP